MPRKFYLVGAAAVLALTAFCANRVLRWIDAKRENPLNDVFASLTPSGIRSSISHSSMDM